MKKLKKNQAANETEQTSARFITQDELNNENIPQNYSNRNHFQSNSPHGSASEKAGGRLSSHKDQSNKGRFLLSKEVRRQDDDELAASWVKKKLGKN